MDFVEICNVYIGTTIIKAVKRIFNSDKICRSYSDLNFGVTFLGTQCILSAECRLPVTFGQNCPTQQSQSHGDS